MIQNTGLLLFLLLFCPFGLNAQTQESIEKDLEKARILTSEDAARSVSLYHKLLKDSEKINFPEGILKCKEALAILYFNNGEYEKVIKISGDVESLALTLNDFPKLAGMYRYLGASYSMLGLKNQVLQSLDKAKICR